MPPTEPVPCTDHPGFLQPAERADWHLDPVVATAQHRCRVECPRDRFRACALDALTAGTLDDDVRPRVADGVVMAGVICRGDAATEHELREIVRGHVELHWRATRPTHCLGCGRPMTTRRRRLPGHVVHESSGRCATCTRARHRAG
ncbi:hypothetical protein [Nocardia sp. BMG111209]|uniref:hypothetical protein n=1 Tax=Nocardia sp. BMG111209 TaxID=1160137 RepID=UPI00037797DA|nr:hypothetical protein [Nocardia sp. BMG111209]